MSAQEHPYDITAPWPAHEVGDMNMIFIQVIIYRGVRADAEAKIAYTAIVGLVMLAASLEWFLWIAAFWYCLVKVFKKAEHWSIRILAIVIGLLFTAFRYATRPPLPIETDKWPDVSSYL